MSNVKGEFNVTSTESRTTCMVGSNFRGSWEIPETSNFSELDRSEKARCHNADVHVSGKSDSLVMCAGQCMSQEGSSPSNAWMRGVLSKSGGNALLAGECRHEEL